MRLSTIVASTTLLATFVHGSPVSYHLRRREVVPRDRIVLTITLDSGLLFPNVTTPATSVESSTTSVAQETTIPTLVPTDGGSGGDPTTSVVKKTKTKTIFVTIPTGAGGTESTTTAAPEKPTDNCSGQDSTTEGPSSTQDSKMTSSTQVPEVPVISSPTLSFLSPPPGTSTEISNTSIETPATSTGSTDAGVSTTTQETATTKASELPNTLTYTLSFVNPPSRTSTTAAETSTQASGSTTGTSEVPATTTEVQSIISPPVSPTEPSTTPTDSIPTLVPTDMPTSTVPTSGGTVSPTPAPGTQDNVSRAITRNQQFSNIKAGDACSFKDVFEVLACAGTLGNTMLQCNKQTLVYEEFQKCPQGSQCFALPLELSGGYSVACMSLENAASTFGMAPADLENKIRTP